jgi:hypothetical protein
MKEKFQRITCTKLGFSLSNGDVKEFLQRHLVVKPLPV